MNPQRSLLLQIHFSQDRYHGAGVWPPSPARVFQALVASAGPQQSLPSNVQDALLWLEALPPPILHAPKALLGQRVQLYVPHNDLDTAGGDPRAVESIRVGKVVQPHLFDARQPISYIWTYAAEPSANAHAEQICHIAMGLYQLGRGVDAAWATAHVLPIADTLEILRHAEGQTLRPSAHEAQGALPEATTMLDCHVPGSLDSLVARYLAAADRFQVERHQKKTTVIFVQPPRAVFVEVPYGSARMRFLFELRSPDGAAEFVHWRLAAAAEIVHRIRDEARARLVNALPERISDIDNALMGRPVQGKAIPAEQRVRIVPLPSIGHEHVDRGIRRILVEVPAGCPLDAQDVRWAFSGLHVANAETGEVSATLVPAENMDMLQHYAIGTKPSRRWRTVTPLALNAQYDLEGPIPKQLAQALADALRHEGVGARAVEVRAQRMPFERHGVEAGLFAPGTRFSEQNLWHVDVVLDRAVRGPLILGDGRYLGLGLLAPVRERGETGLLCYRITGGLAAGAVPEGLARALRRAVMSRCGERKDGALHAYVHGHDGPRPMRNAPHVHYQFDPGGGCLWILAPHVVQRRGADSKERAQWNDVADVMAGFSRLLAGDAGALDVRPEIIDAGNDPLLRACTVWESVTPYVANRHRDAGSAHAALIEDVQQSLVDGRLPAAQVEVLRCRGTSRGLEGDVRLTFPTAMTGPIVLGRRRFVGGGLFRGVQE